MTSLALTYFPLIPGVKLPAIKEWQKTKPGQYPAVGNYGIALPPDILVLDFDFHKAQGVESWNRFSNRYPNLVTRIVRTPRGGLHVYLRKPADLKLKSKNQAGWPAVDFQSEGQYVVGPGTTTIKTADSAAGTYLLEGDAPIADAPADFLAALELATPAILQGSGTSLALEDEFKLQCETEPPAEQGSRGITAFKMAAQAKDKGLPVDVAYKHMRDLWLPRWNAPITESELYTQCQRGYKYAKNAAGNQTPEAVFHASIGEAPPAKDSSILAVMPSPPSNVVSMQDVKDDHILQALRPDMLQIDGKGNPTDCLANVACLLKVDPAWRGKIIYNQFAGALEFTDRPVWRRSQMNVDCSVEKRDIRLIQVWFSSKRMEIGETKLVAALEAVADPVHPVKRYLEALKWDGIPRLDRILADTAGADDNLLNRDIGRCILIGAVRRIYEPGCKHDDVPIFEGPQGTRKSMWIQVLGGEWASTGQLVRGDKDTYQNLRGKWFVELPEINATFSKWDANWLKGIISTATDTYRASYAAGSRSVPRESIFLGTINPQAGGEYLTDDENRRYLPVKTRAFDVERLKRDRDQYFAEAFHRYQAGEQAWISDPQIRLLARAAQEQRREKDPLVDILQDSEWLTKPGGVTPAEVYAGLGYTPSTIASHQRRRVYAALRELGYEHVNELGTGGKWIKTRITWADVL